MTDAERIEELEREVARLNRCLEDAQKAVAAYKVEREEDHRALRTLSEQRDSLVAALEEEKARNEPLTRESLFRAHRLLTAADALKRSLNAHDNSEAIKALEDEAYRVAGVVR